MPGEMALQALPPADHFQKRITSAPAPHAPKRCTAPSPLRREGPRLWRRQGDRPLRFLSSLGEGNLPIWGSCNQSISKIYDVWTGFKVTPGEAGRARLQMKQK